MFLHPQAGYIAMDFPALPCMPVSPHRVVEAGRAHLVDVVGHDSRPSRWLVSTACSLNLGCIPLCGWIWSAMAAVIGQPRRRSFCLCQHPGWKASLALACTGELHPVRS